MARSLALAVGLVLGACPAGWAASPAPLSHAPGIQEMGVLAVDPRLAESDRVELVRSLANWGGDEVRGPLLLALKDRSALVRETAAAGLGSPEHRAAAPALQERLEARDEEPAVRAAAARALGTIGDMSTRDAMLAATRDADHAVRQSALWGLTLGALQKPDDRADLLVQLATDRALDLGVRVEAIQALGQMGARAAVTPMARLLDGEASVPMALPSPKANQQEIMGVRYRQARDVRAWAADTLGKLDARDQLPLLLRAAEDPDDFFLRQMALRVLVRWKAPEAAPVYVRRLDDAFDDNRMVALEGLALAGDPALIAPVRGRLSDGSPRVRMYAVLALAELGGKGAAPELRAMRERETDPYVMRTLEATLAQLER